VDALRLSTLPYFYFLNLTALAPLREENFRVGRGLQPRPSSFEADDTLKHARKPTDGAELLGWKAERGIETICEDHWRWQIIQMAIDKSDPLVFFRENR